MRGKRYSILALGLFLVIALLLTTTGFQCETVEEEVGQQTLQVLRIAYVKDGNIWTMKPDGGDKKQITSMKPNEKAYSLSYSQTAQRIWFIRAYTFMAESIPLGDVFSVKTDGTDMKQVTSGLKASFAAVSPDGEKIGVCVSKTIPNVYPSGQSGDTWDLWIMNANGKEQTASASHVDVSGDLPASGIGGREGAFYCSWSSDEKIVFTFKGDTSGSLGISTRQLYTANKDGSNRQKIAGSMDHPVFSRNGKYIAAEFGAHFNMIGIKAITTAGADYKEVLAVPTTGELYAAARPCWQGETDTRVVYTVTTHPANLANQTTTLYVCALSNLNKTAIVNQSQVGGPPSKPQAQPLGTKIVFQAGKTGEVIDVRNASIWIVDISGSGLKQLTSGLDDRDPIWIGK